MTISTAMPELADALSPVVSSLTGAGVDAPVLETLATGSWDWAVIGFVITMAVIGLFRGFSGSLGIIVGGACSAAAGVYAWNCLEQYNLYTWQQGAAVLTIALVTFGIVRIAIKKFVHKMLAQPTDAILGLLAWLALAAAALFLLAHNDIGVKQSKILEKFKSGGAAVIAPGGAPREAESTPPGEI